MPDRLPPHSRRPLLLLDVDGVLVVVDVVLDADGWPASFEPVLKPVAAALLARLTPAFDIWWNTRWGDLANTELAPQLGLPRLPVVDLSAWEDRFSKVGAVRSIVGDRSAAWIDDEIGADEEQWATARARTIPTLLVQTDPDEGITTQHVDELLAFAASLQA